MTRYKVSVLTRPYGDESRAAERTLVRYVSAFNEDHATEIAGNPRGLCILDVTVRALG